MLAHYELMSDHLATTKGYEAYGRAGELLRAARLDALCEQYLAVQAHGTPEQIVERLAARRELIGDYDLTACFRFAGLADDDAEASMWLFAAEVLPRTREWRTEARAAVGR